MSLSVFTGNSERLEGPAAIPFTSRDACNDSIIKLFRDCFYGVPIA